MSRKDLSRDPPDIEVGWACCSRALLAFLLVTARTGVILFYRTFSL